MLRKTVLFLLLVLAILILAVEVSSQETSVTVKRSDVVSGVIIVDISKAGKSFELRCNQGMANCTPLTTGRYVMVELPPNFGMYDCKGVEVYRESANGTGLKSEKVGEYCLLQK